MERKARWEGISVWSVAFFTYEFWQKPIFSITSPENTIFIEVVTGLNEQTARWNLDYQRRCDHALRQRCDGTFWVLKPHD